MRAPMSLNIQNFVEGKSMSHKKRKLIRFAGIVVVLLLLVFIYLYTQVPREVSLQVSPDFQALTNEQKIERGKYIFDVSGGCRCHQVDGEPFMSGGRAVKTPFGALYAGNITPDKKTGIGAWSDKDFVRAMKLGTDPSGSHYYPIFPYTSFQSMTTEDVLALKAYLFSLAPVEKENHPSELYFPFNLRINAFAWKMLFFRPHPIDVQKERGKYLVEAVSHCQECHTPRNIFGALQMSRLNAGSAQGPEGEPAPNITLDKKTGIGDYSFEDFSWMMTMGFKADGEDIMGLMGELIAGYRETTEEDLHLMYDYLMSVPPITNNIKKEE